MFVSDYFQLNDEMMDKMDSLGVFDALLDKDSRFFINIIRLKSSTVPEFIEAYLVFHELTHLVDYDCFVHGDKNRSLMIRGYSEYHAGQIDLTKLLGNTTVNSIPDFFMSDQIEGIGGRKSVNEYVGQSLQLVVDLLQRPDFPANPETLMTVLSSANNYWGRKSICELSQTG